LWLNIASKINSKKWSKYTSRRIYGLIIFFFRKNNNILMREFATLLSPKEQSTLLKGTTKFKHVPII